MSCLICDKHEGKGAQPPGGYIYQDGNWMVGHYSPDASWPGQLVVESRRHFLDFAEMTPEESASIGPLLSRLYSAVRRVTGAERVYALVLLEGVPHFHCHLIPRGSDSSTRGMTFLSQDWSCAESEAVEAAQRLREVLHHPLDPARTDS
jgi:diadenosine tetraphosphate (Ap4A) HIT family hydrolase